MVAIWGFVLWIANGCIFHIICVHFFAIGLSLMHKVLGAKERPGIFYYIISFVFLTEIGVRTQLSYRYMASFFGLAFMICMLGCWCIVNIKKDWMAVAFSAVCFALGMGFYQVDIGCAALVLLMNLLCILYNNQYYRLFWKQMLKDSIAGGLGIGLYMIIYKVLLHVNQVPMSVRVGSNGLKATVMISTIPNNILRCYRGLIEYFVLDEWNKNVFQNGKLLYGLVALLFLVGTVSVMIGMIKTKGKCKPFLWVVLILLSPVFLIAAIL